MSIKVMREALVFISIILSYPGLDGIALASTNNFSQSSLGPTIGYLNGDTTYHISYYSGPSGIESELEFPLKTVMAGIAWIYRSERSGRNAGFILNARWLTNLDNGTGKMKDSDWLTDDLDIVEVGSAHPGKDIYSESDIQLKATVIDLNVTLDSKRKSKWHIMPIFGYKYQNFQFDVSNTYQVGYGPYAPGYTGFIPGKTLDYEITYNIFYIAATSRIVSNDSFTADLKLGFSPYTKADDRDDHILRAKLSTANTDGYAYLAELNAKWNMSEYWWFNLRGEYLNISTTGQQFQYFYAGPDAGLAFSVDDKITSLQWFISAFLEHKF